MQAEGKPFFSEASVSLFEQRRGLGSTPGPPPALTLWDSVGERKGPQFLERPKEDWLQVGGLLGSQVVPVPLSFIDLHCSSRRIKSGRLQGGRGRAPPLSHPHEFATQHRRGCPMSPASWVGFSGSGWAGHEQMLLHSTWHFQPLKSSPRKDCN